VRADGKQDDGLDLDEPEDKVTVEGLALEYCAVVVACILEFEETLKAVNEV
jgi:hypothetical protein